MIMTKNIIAAYNAELQYYQDKESTQSNVLDIMDYIRPCGYDTYEEYYADVQEYKLKIQDYAIVEEPYIDPNMPKPYLNNRQSALLYTIHCDTNYAFVKSDYDDEELLTNYGYTMRKLGYEGGSGPILSADGDLRIYLIYPIQIELTNNYFLNKLAACLSNYYDNVSVDNNDVLINNEKVCGSIMFHYNDMRIVVMQINFVDKKEAIQEICGITNKVPGYIDPSLLTAENLLNEFKTWLKL